MKITYFLEVFSSWCYWVEPTWAELKKRYAGRAEFEWKIALMNPEDFPVSREQCEWFYRRSGGTFMQSTFMLNSGWYEASRKGNYDAANLVAEAAKDFGYTGDEVRLALSHAALREGQKLGNLAAAVAVAAKAGNLNAKELATAAGSKAVRERVDASTREFHSYQINQRPAFVLTNAIGDKAIFSGFVAPNVFVTTLDDMLVSDARYASHEAHHGRPPKN